MSRSSSGSQHDSGNYSRLRRQRSREPPAALPPLDIVTTTSNNNNNNATANPRTLCPPPPATVRIPNAGADRSSSTSINTAARSSRPVPPSKHNAPAAGRDDAQNSSGSRSGIPAAPPPPTYLVALSESCQKHAASAHARTIDGGGGSDSGGGGATLAYEPPCRDALDLLRRVLPQLEARATASPPDLSHLCDFYQDAVRGGFCPHAPRLFLNPTDCTSFVRRGLGNIASDRKGARVPTSSE